MGKRLNNSFGRLFSCPSISGLFEAGQQEHAHATRACLPRPHSVRRRQALDPARVTGSLQHAVPDESQADRWLSKVIQRRGANYRETVRCLHWRASGPCGQILGRGFRGNVARRWDDPFQRASAHLQAQAEDIGPLERRSPCAARRSPCAAPFVVARVFACHTIGSWSGPHHDALCHHRVWFSRTGPMT